MIVSRQLYFTINLEEIFYFCNKKNAVFMRLSAFRKRLKHEKKERGAIPMETIETTIHEENEQKKEYLKSYRRAIKREQDILDEIQRLRLDKMFPSVVNDGMPHGSSHSDLSDYAAILDEQIDLLKEERLEKVRCYQKIERQISQMENEDEQEVLRLRYILGMKWEEVAVKMNYSWKWVHKIHGRALLNFRI